MPPFLNNDSLHEPDDVSLLQHGYKSVGSLVLFSITFLLGLLGNGLVIWVIALKMKRTVNTTWFLHLAIADLVCCLSLPFSIVHLVIHERWPYGWFFCKIIPSVIILNMFASVFLLTTISIDRCLVVMKPVWCQNHRTVRLASVMCGLNWLLAFVMCSPAFIYRKTVADDFGNTKCVYSWRGNDYGEGVWLNDSHVFFSQHPAIMPSASDEDTTMDGTLDNYQTLTLPSISDSINTSEKSQGHRANIPDALDISGSIDSSAMAVTSPTPKRLVSPRPQLNTGLSNTLQSDDLGLFYPDSYYGNHFAGNDSMEMFPDYYFSENQPPGVLVSVTITRSVLGFFLPFGIMAACYALIAHKMLTNQFAKSRRKALQVILLVIAIFFLCWAPYHVIEILFLLAAPGTEFHEILASWDHVSTALAYVNSCINPILYVFVGRKFREKARRSVLGILEGAFSEEGTHSTACSQDRSKPTLNKDIDSSHM